MTLATNEPTLLALVALEYAACCLQMIHLPLRAASLHRGHRRGQLAYELVVLAHLLVAACFTLGEGARGPSLQGVVLASPWAAYLWVNAAGALLALAFALRERSTHALLEALLMGLCTPPTLRALGPAWVIVAFADVALFVARGAAELLADHARRAAEPTQLSVVETINAIPTGLLATDGHGRSLVMNNAMRALLERLGCPTDLGDLSGLWELLERHACAPGATGAVAPQADALEQFIVPDAYGGVARVTRVNAADGRVFFLAEGVTEQYLANQRLEQANAELEQAGAALRERLADVGAIAEADAYLRMRQRVHDVVGQRLSILHRYLEEGRVDEDSVASLAALLTSIPRDLHGQGSDVAASLDAVVRAFSLVDVGVRVTGELPRNTEVASAFARIVREAATNACRHGHARMVSVVLGSRAGERDGRAGQDGRSGRLACLCITDDGAGMPGGRMPREGNGITGMRHALASVGGALAIVAGQPFTLYAEAPDPVPATAAPHPKEIP